MIKNELKKYDINLSDVQIDLISNYLDQLEKSFKKEKIDMESYNDIKINIIERLIENKKNLTDEYIKQIINDLGKVEEIIEPFKRDKSSIIEEFKQIFPLSGDKQLLLKYYLKLLVKIFAWIGISLGIVIGFFSVLLFFINFSIFNIDLIGSIPSLLKFDLLLIALLIILISSYFINFKKSKLRNYFIGLNIIFILIISIISSYNLFYKYNNLNTYNSDYELNDDLKIDSGKRYEIGDINLFGPLEGNIFYTLFTKELTKEYLKENKNSINYITGNNLKIDVMRTILGDKRNADLFNKNISNIKIKIQDNKIYIFRDGYYFINKTILLPFNTKIKIDLPKNIILKKKYE